jgi:hypothetical protein
MKDNQIKCAQSSNEGNTTESGGRAKTSESGGAAVANGSTAASAACDGGRFIHSMVDGDFKSRRWR